MKNFLLSPSKTTLRKILLKTKSTSSFRPIFSSSLNNRATHSNVFKLACEACRRHYPQESILCGLTVFFEHTDFRAEELTSVLSSGYKQVNNQTSATVPPAYSPCQKDIRTKVPYGTLENSDSTEEAYWLGEEFRKETLYFLVICTIIFPTY